MIKTYEVSNIAFDVSSLAVQSMLYEVACVPSPGLVSVVSTGAHKDMNHYTFINSTCSLIKYLTLCVQLGFTDESPKDILKKAKFLGMDAEKEMFKKTQGVNTHKGMLFLMGISCVAVGKVIHDNKEFNEVQQIIKDMCSGIVERDLLSLKKYIKEYKTVEDIANSKKLSYGEKLFLMYGMKGIRGEVEEGLPIIFDFSLDFYEHCSDLNENDRLVNTLIGIMQYSEDSNILHRHTLDVLKEMQDRARNILSIGGMRTKKGREEIAKLDKEFSSRRISPGGSADLLAVTVFFSLVKEYINKDLNYVKEEKNDKV